MERVVGKWIVNKRLPDEGYGSCPWGVYTSQGLEMYTFRTWDEAMAVATVLSSMTTYVDFRYEAHSMTQLGSIFDAYDSPKLRILHENERTSWIINHNVINEEKVG